MQRLRKAIKRHPKLEHYSHYAGRFLYALRQLLVNGAYMNWAYLVLDDKKVVYIAVQKVACTSIKASMAGVDSGEDYIEVIMKVRGTGRVIKQIDLERCRGYFVFTFVRNPFSRLVSCYENKYHSDRELRDLMQYQYYLLGYLSKDRGFRAFASRVCTIPDRLADHHFVSQSFLIDRMGRNPKPDFVGHFENLAEEYEPIRQKYDFLPLPHHNRTDKAGSWMDYYDLPTAEKVYRRYRQDIERFGYQGAYDELVAYLKAKETKGEAPGAPPSDPRQGG